MINKLLTKIKSYFFSVVEVPSLEEESVTKDTEKIHILIIKVLAALLLIAVLIFFMYTIANENKRIPNMVTNDVLVSKTISDEEFLHKVSIGKIEDIISALDMGANPNAKDSSGRNAFIIGAISDVKPEIINILKSYGTNINDIDINGYNAFMYSVLANGRNSYNYLNNLIKSGINVNNRTKTGISTLMVVVSTTNNTKIIEMLLKGGADINYVDENNVTALMLAAKMSQNPDVIPLLLKYKANKYIKDTNKVTAFDNLLTNKYLRDNKELRKLLNTKK